MMKRYLKKYLPEKAQKVIKNKKNIYYINELYNLDKKRFKKNYNSNLNTMSLEKLEARLMFDTHALEKGFSHTSFRPHFGVNALKSMASTLKIYEERGFKKDRERYKISLSALKHYITIHESKGNDISFLKEIFPEEILKEVSKAEESFSGTNIVRKDDKVDNSLVNFKDLAQNRISVREFSKERPNKSNILEAIEIALKSPSVCNRQPSRVYLLSEKSKIEKVLLMQGGYRGFETPPYLILITSTMDAFVSPNERNEGFIDGGIFSMSLLYALEYKGLAACALNAMLGSKSETGIRNFFDLPQNEILIMFIAVGGFKEQTLSPKSKRDDLSYVLREV